MAMREVSLPFMDVDALPDEMLVEDDYLIDNYLRRAEGALAAISCNAAQKPVRLHWAGLTCLRFDSSSPTGAAMAASAGPAMLVVRTRPRAGQYVRC